MFHYDNAPTTITEFLTSNGVPVLPQPLHFHLYAVPMIFLFSELKNVLKGRHLGTLGVTQNSKTAMLKIILSEDFQQWK